MKKARKNLSLLLAVLLLTAALTPAASAAGNTCRTPVCQLRSYVLCRMFGICPAAEKTVTEPAAQKEAQPAAPAVSVPDTVSAYERRVAELVNEKRARYGLSPLTLDASLCEKARVKSQDMAKNRYFDHNSPTYGSPFAMMRSFGISYRHAGENIAKGFSSPEDVVSAWMQSETHRANILSANFTSIGVGYVANGGYWTQWFIG